jgi:hypothetical protein
MNTKGDKLGQGLHTRWISGYFCGRTSWRGARWIFIPAKRYQPSPLLIVLPHEQSRDDSEFRLQWTRDVYRPR